MSKLKELIDNKELEKTSVLLQTAQNLMQMNEDLEATALSFLMSKHVLVKAGIDVTTLDFDEWDKQFFGDLLK